MIIEMMTEYGWKPADNESECSCDLCGAGLLIGPGGGLYCQEMHGVAVMEEALA